MVPYFINLQLQIWLLGLHSFVGKAWVRADCGSLEPATMSFIQLEFYHVDVEIVAIDFLSLFCVCFGTWRTREKGEDGSVKRP